MQKAAFLFGVDMKELDFEHFDGFAAEVRSRAIRGIILRETREIRPSYGEKHSVIIGLVHEAALVAYENGEMLRCRLTGDEIPAAVRQLAGLGVTVKRVNGNIT